MLNIPHTYLAVIHVNPNDLEAAASTYPESANPHDEVVEALDARLDECYPYDGQCVRLTTDGIVGTDLDALRVLLAAASVGLDGADEGSGHTAFDLDRAHRLLRNLTAAIGSNAPPTYHGLMRATCHACGHVYSTRSTLETLNDLGEGCHACGNEHAVIRWENVDGSTSLTWIDEAGDLHVFNEAKS